MGPVTILALVFLIDSYLISAEDIPLDSFTYSVEGPQIKSKPGRHVCTTEKTISRPIPVIQTYRKPVYKPHPRECPNVSSCPQFDVSYILANRTVFQLQKSSTYQMNCCPGWTKENKREKGCMQPICKTGCGEFGICIKPKTCECRKGYTGPMCDTDIDECRTSNHGCQHQCKNTAGGYLCSCQEGFTLSADGRTCIFCFTCQKEYQEIMASISALTLANGSSVAPVSNDQSVEVRALNSTIHELKQELLRVTAAENVEVQSVNSTIQGLKLELLKVTEENAEFRTLNSSIQELKVQLLQVTEENTKLKEQVVQLEMQYDNTAFDIEFLQNITRTTTPAPTTSTTTPETTSTTTPTTTTKTTTPTTTTTSTTTPSTTTTPRTTTPTTTETQTHSELQFDSLDMIYSLSNQIGLMEEKLELCQCTVRRGRGFG